MVERRSLGAAMEITPEKLAFIKGETTTASAPNAEKKTSDVDLPPAPKAQEKTIEVAVSSNQLESVNESPLRITRRSKQRSSSNLPAANEVLDQVLVPITIRFPRRIAQALKRAYLEQRLKHAKPDTQQEIAEEALTEWLENNNYL